jgi:hypothetical protein
MVVGHVYVLCSKNSSSLVYFSVQLSSSLILSQEQLLLLSFHDLIFRSLLNTMAGGGSDSESIWLYNPSFALAIVVAIIYLVPTSVLTWQTFIKYRSWFFLCVLIGSALEVGGYIIRAVSARDQSSIVCNPFIPSLY